MMRPLELGLLHLLIGTLLAAHPLSSFAQQAAQKAATPEPDDTDIVRITTNLVQLDVVVTDNKGKLVSDLSVDDFEMFEDGKPQQITNFSFVINDSSAATSSPSTAVKSTTVAPGKVKHIEDPHRTIVIVVDDLKMSFESAVYARRAIRKFVEERMLPNDLVGIVRTSAGVGALQQLTSDKRQLFAATQHVRGGGLTILESLKRCRNSSLAPVLDPTIDTPAESRPGSEFDGFYEQSSFSGSLGALSFIVRGLREVPGRKAVMLISEGLVLCPEEQLKLGTLFEDRMRKIADQANRSSAVVYHIDPRGLVALDSAADGGSGNAAASLQRLSNASRMIFESQRSFDPIVYPTGGFALFNNNDILGALQRVVDDQKGYYLIGYRPSEASFDSKDGRFRFNNVKVKLKRSGLTVRTRSGFYGFTDTKVSPVKRTRAEQLFASLASPFATGAIDVRLTPLFGNDANGSFMLSMLHIDPAGLTFTKQPDGWQQAILDVLAVTFDADGQLVEQVSRNQTIRARGNTLERITKNGIVYSLSVPIKKPGAYQLRFAVRDAASEQVGSASQFIEVPNLGKNKLVLSGIALRESKSPGGAGGSVDRPVVQPSSIRSDREATYSEPQGGPARRQFQKQSTLQYDYVIYNASVGTGRPQLKTQLSVLRDGQEVHTEELRDLDISGQTDLKRLKTAGTLLLGEKFLPGQYVLRITVVDALPKGDSATVNQTIDFEIVQ